MDTYQGPIARSEAAQSLTAQRVEAATLANLAAPDPPFTLSATVRRECRTRGPLFSALSREHRHIGAPSASVTSSDGASVHDARALSASPRAAARAILRWVAVTD